MAALWPDQRVVRRAGFAQADRLGHQAVAVGRLAHQFDQLRHVKRLEQIIVSAEFGRLDGGFGGAKGGDQNDGQARLGGVQLADQFQPVQARQPQIGDDQIEGIPTGPRQSVVPAPLDGHLVAFVRQHPLQSVGDAGVVLNQQNFCGGAHAAACGNMMPKVVP